MCTKPPQCVFLRQNRSRGARFTSLEDGSIPVFPIERSITIKNYSIRRRQVPMCAAFSLTDYKTQGQSSISLKPCWIWYQKVETRTENFAPSP